MDRDLVGLAIALNIVALGILWWDTFASIPSDGRDERLTRDHRLGSHRDIKPGDCPLCREK